jgi:hypothetical protein
MSLAAAPSPQYRRIVPPEEADQRLADFGMTVAIIRQSIEDGDSARRQVMQPVYPSTFPGVTMWADTLASWRKQMLKRQDGYEIGKTRGYETIYSMKRGVAFAVVAGDCYTGIDGARDPRPTREKGVTTTERVGRNREASAVDGTPGVQGVLIELPKKELPPDEACETWFLLIHPTEDEVRIELSRPVLMQGGLVVGYSERILLSPVPISGAVAPIAPGDGEDGGSGGEQLVRRPER